MSSFGPDFPRLLQHFFLQRLGSQRGASPRTIASYRDTFALLLRFAERHTGRHPSALALEDLDAPLVLAFLDHLERERGNGPRTRNLRLTAIRSFLRYATLRDPASLPAAQRVLAAACKRCPSLAGRRVSPHTLRHTTAMHLLQSGVDLTVIALLLGHEDPGTTHMYLEADLAMKEAALRHVADPSPRRPRFRASDRLLAFLKTL